MNNEITIIKTATGNFLVQIWGVNGLADEAEFVSGDDALRWIKDHLGDMTA